MSKAEPELNGPPVTFYCLFRLNDSSQSSSTGSSSPFSSIGSTGFSASSFTSPVETGETMDLEVVATDLHEDWQKQLKLKKHILSKCTSRMTYESGSIILLPTLVAKNKVLPPTKCHWSVMKDKDNRRYILCLISASEAEGFSLFRYDLEKYVKKVESEYLMVQNIDQADVRAALVSFLQNWYHIAVDYVSRAALMLSEELDVLIHSCLMGHKIDVKTMMPANAQLVEDAVRLIEAIQLPIPSGQQQQQQSTGSSESAPGSTSSISGSDSAISRDAVTLTFDHAGKPQIDANETNAFCREWAARLIQGGSRPLEAILLRSWTEVVKMQITQELNHIRKLSEAAVIDNYALYEAFLYLKNNPNKDVLLVLLMKEIASDSSTKEVLHTIFKCLTTPLWDDPQTGEDASTEERITESDLLL